MFVFQLLCDVLHIDWELVFVFQSLCDVLYVDWELVFVFWLLCGVLHIDWNWCLCSRHCAMNYTYSVDWHM